MNITSLKLSLALVVSMALPLSPTVAGKLADNPDWRSCISSGGSARTCYKQVIGLSTERASSGDARTFVPSSSLSAAQEARVNQMVTGHPAVMDARSRAINAQNNASIADWYGRDGRTRAIGAQNSANLAIQRSCPSGWSSRAVRVWRPYAGQGQWERFSTCN